MPLSSKKDIRLLYKVSKFLISFKFCPSKRKCPLLLKMLCKAK